MNGLRILLPAAALVGEALVVLHGADSARLKEDEIWRHRNLGKAFYENPTTQVQAVDEFKKALSLAPDSPRERLNYGLALLRAGKTKEGVVEIEKAQKQDPKIPHTWFNLGIVYKKDSQYDKAIAQLEGMIRLVPDEPKSHYNLAVLYKLNGNIDGAGRPDALAWSSSGAVLLKNGSTPVAASGLEGVKNIVSIAAGDYNNDGLPDLCVITESGAALYSNKQGKFQKEAVKLPPGHYEKAVWIDYDHDYDLDLILLGENSKLMRNNGAAGFSDQTADFPFVKGHALSGAAFELIADTNGVDLVVSYEDRVGVLYRDKLTGKYEALPIDGLPEGVESVSVYDIDNDGWMDLAASGPRGTTMLYNRQGKITAANTLERICSGD